MSNLLITLFAYLIDRKFGEFTFLKHPLIFIKELIAFFEEKFYKDSVLRGFLLVAFVLLIVSVLAIPLYLYLALLPFFINVIFSSLIASLFITHKMLRDSVYALLNTDDDNHSDLYKSCIENYAQNLSTEVIAPLFYLLLFNLPGIILYKTINTIHLMSKDQNEKYKNYGKVAAILDHAVNFIPSRLSAFFIMLFAKQRPLFAFYADGKKHDSPNAGHPISAMALAVGVKLGTKSSPLGNGKEFVEADDLTKVLAII